MALSQEYSVALVTRMRNEASSGFDELAADATRAADAIDRSEDKIARSVEDTERRVQAATRRTAAAFQAVGPNIASRRAELLKRFDTEGLDNIGLFRGIRGAKDMAELGVYERRLENVAAKTRVVAQETAAAASMMGRLTGAAASLAGGVIGGVLGFALFEVGRQLTDVAFGFAEVADKAEDLQNLKLRTGINVEELQALKFTADQTKNSFEAVVQGAKSLAKAIADNSPILAALGIATRDASGNLRSVEDVLYDVADAYRTSTDETSKIDVATRLFGKSGEQLIPMLELGRQGLAQFQAQAAATGNIIEQENIKPLEELDAKLDTMRAKWDGFILHIKLAIAEQVNNTLGGEKADLISPEEEGRLRDQARVALARQEFGKLYTNLTPGELATVDAEVDQLLKKIETARREARELAKKPAVEGVTAEGDLDPRALERLANERDRVANAKERADATERAEKAAESFEKRLAGIQSSLDNEISVKRARELAEAFATGEINLRGLLGQLQDNEAVTRIAREGQYLAAGIAKYGEAWDLIEPIVAEHTKGITNTQDRIQAATDALAEFLDVETDTKAGAKEISDWYARGVISVTELVDRFTELNELQRRYQESIEKTRPRGEIPMPELLPVPPPTKPGGIGGGLNETVADRALDAAQALEPSSLFSTALDTAGAELEGAIAKWERDLNVFRGTFGRIMEQIVAQAVTAFIKLQLLKLFDIATTVATGGVPVPFVGGGGDAGGIVPRVGTRPVSAVPVGRPAATAEAPPLELQAQEEVPVVIARPRPVEARQAPVVELEAPPPAPTPPPPFPRRMLLEERPALELEAPEPPPAVEPPAPPAFAPRRPPVVVRQAPSIVAPVPPVVVDRPSRRPVPRPRLDLDRPSRFLEEPELETAAFLRQVPSIVAFRPPRDEREERAPSSGFVTAAASDAIAAQANAAARRNEVPRGTVRPVQLTMHVNAIDNVTAADSLRSSFGVIGQALAAQADAERF